MVDIQWVTIIYKPYKPTDVKKCKNGCFTMVYIV